MSTTAVLTEPRRDGPMPVGGRRRWRLTALVVLFAVAAVAAMVGFVIGRNQAPSHRVTVLRGTAYGDADGTSIGFQGRRIAGPEIDPIYLHGFDVAGVPWFDGHSWHEGGSLDPPACLRPVRDAQGFPTKNAKSEILLGVFLTDPYKDAPGRAPVVWLKCL